MAHDLVTEVLRVGRDSGHRTIGGARQCRVGRSGAI